MRIGILGGTFDPIHIGHLAMAESAYREFDLDEVWFMPNGDPPHKQVEHNAKRDLEHRIEMIKLAIAPIPYFRLNMSEAQVHEHSYTYATLRKLQETYPVHKYFFVMGADSLYAIEQWKNFTEIFPQCNILVARRNDNDMAQLYSHIAYLHRSYGANVELLHSPLIDVSSSQIRKAIEAQEDLNPYLPDVVADYICKEGLYR